MERFNWWQTVQKNKHVFLQIAHLNKYVDDGGLMNIHCWLGSLWAVQSNSVSKPNLSFFLHDKQRGSRATKCLQKSVWTSWAHILPKATGATTTHESYSFFHRDSLFEFNHRSIQMPIAQTNLSVFAFSRMMLVELPARFGVFFYAFGKSTSLLIPPLKRFLKATNAQNKQRWPET